MASRAQLFTASGGAFRRRDVTDAVAAFVYGQSLPSANGVGPIDVSSLRTTHTTDQTVSGNNQLIENTHFKSVLNVTGNGNRFRNCKVSGRPITSYPGSNGWVNFNQGAGNIFEQGEISGSPDGGVTDNGTQYHNGVVGSGYTLDRCYVWGVNDGVYHGLTGESTVKGCLFDYLRFTLDDGAHGSDTRVPGWSHNDPIQWRQGTMHIVGNEFIGRFHPTMGDGAGAAGLTVEGTPKWWNLHDVILNPVGTMSGEIDDNWFWGGENAVTGATPSGGPTTGHSVAIRRNRIVPNQCISYGSRHVQITVPSSYGVTFANNVFWDHPDTPANLRGQAMPFIVAGTADVSRIN